MTVPPGLVLYLPELAAAEAQAVYLGNERLGRRLRFPTVYRAELSRTDAPTVARLLAEANARDGPSRAGDLRSETAGLTGADHRPRPCPCQNLIRPGGSRVRSVRDVERGP
ncbi:MAG: hypothetical protein LC799_22710 [Actinobacteria bacterium]|nr:hypothetical protein [Actinomycetota bacterium]